MLRPKPLQVLALETKVDDEVLVGDRLRIAGQPRQLGVGQVPNDIFPSRLPHDWGSVIDRIVRLAQVRGPPDARTPPA